MTRLKNIIECSDTGPGRIFDFCLQALIVLSLVTFSLETIPDLNGATRSWLYYIEVATVIVFTVEYILRLMVADNKSAFVFSFFGIVDLAAILPFYVASGIDLRSIRAVRLLRLLRAFKLVRYSKAVSRIHRALLIAREELVLFGIVSLMMLYFAAVGIYYFENTAQPEAFSSVFTSFWWAICTLTTVGYGDVYPITTGGRIFTFIVLMIGLGLVSVPAGLMASALSKARELDE
ncbi:MAG: ion transporter [Phycisphaerae bacterium]|nr:MAG: ion transporter [Phycisphaerae bacterium]